MSPEEIDADTKLIYYFPSETTPIEDRRNQSSMIRGMIDFSVFCSNGQIADITKEYFKVRSSNNFIIAKNIGGIFLAIVFDFSSGVTEQYCMQMYGNFLSIFHLLHGPIQSLSANGTLSDMLDDFVPSYVAAESSGDAKNIFFTGIRYAAVDRHGFVGMHALNLEILANHETEILESIILFDGNLVCSSLSPERLRPLYEYLVMNTRTGAVDHAKLSVSPYGRIGTPAALPGGGSSSFGRSNRFSENSGWLFGPTGEGECVFCPSVHVVPESSSDVTGQPMAAFVISKLMFIFLFAPGKKQTFSTFREIEIFLTDNNELHKEILPLLVQDAAAANAADLKEQSSSLEFTYLNKLNQSMMCSVGSNGIKQNTTHAGPRKFWSSMTANFIIRSNPSSNGTTEMMSEQLSGRMRGMIADRDDVFEIAVKLSPNDGWQLVKKSKSDREMFFKFKNPKFPLWKILEDIEVVSETRFSSVYI